METSFVTCVICPKGCSISVNWEYESGCEQKDGSGSGAVCAQKDGSSGEADCECKAGPKKVLKVTGNSCPRGLKYATAEVIHPERVLTSTVRVKNGSLALLPIRSATPIPKETMLEAMKTISATVVDVADFCANEKSLGPES